jgi:hypothetical protein
VIVIYRVISQDSVTSRAFQGQLKEHLKREFQQQEILIVEREVPIKIQARDTGDSGNGLLVIKVWTFAAWRACGWF